LVSENPPLDPAQNKEFQGFRQDEDITNSLSQILNQINSGECKDPEILNLLPNTQGVSDKSLQVQAEVELREHLLEISKAPEISKEIHEISIQIENLTIRKKGTNAKVQQIEDEICDLNSQLQSKDQKIKELEALLKKSSPAVFSKSIPKIHGNQVDQSLSGKKKRSPVKVMNVSKEKRKDESHIKAEQWTQKYQKILKGSGKVINMRAKLPHRRITKQIQGITPRIWKKPPILDQLRSNEKIRKKESKTFGSRSFHSNKFNKKTPVANKFMESAPPVLDLLEHK